MKLGLMMNKTLQTLVAPWLAACALTMSALALPAAWAQDDEGQRLQLPADEVARLRSIIETPIDPNALKERKVEQYRLKESAAWKLGDMKLREQFLREFAEIADDGKWTLRDFLAGTEKRDEAYAIGHELIKTMKWPPSAVRIRTTMALNYIDDSKLKDANALLTEAENIIKNEWSRMSRAGANAYWMVRAEMEFNNVKARYLMRTGKWNEGIQTSKLAVSKGKDLLGQEGMIDLRQRNYGRTGYMFTMQELATHQMVAGLYADADWTLRESYRLYKQLGLSENQMVGLYTRLADLRNATGQFKEAEPYAQRSEKIVLEQGYKKGAPNWLWTQLRTNVALLGQERWKDALANFEDIDAATKDFKNVSNIARQVHIRSVVYLKNGRHADALRMMDGNLKWHVNNYGENHYFTAFSRGVYAVALFKNGQADAARTQFDLALRNITAPAALTGEFAEDAVRRKYKRFIFENYMQLLAMSAANSPADAELLFELADYVNNSSVQQALSDAAIRSGVSTPGLADIIRQEQDAKNEVASLTSYITAQGSEGEKTRNAQVVTQMRERLKDLEAQRKVYKTKIQKDFPDYFQLLQPKAPGPKDIAQQLKPDELFVSVIPMEEQTYVWAIAADGSIRFHRWDMGERQIHALVDRLRKTLDVAEMGARAPTFDYAASHQVYQGMLAPFESSLQGKAHVIVATSGALAKMPFAVLTRQPYAGKDPGQAPWLILDTAVSHVPTASGWLALKRQSKQASGSQALMAWGDPVFDKSAQKVAAAGEAHIRAGGNLRSALQTGIEQADTLSFLNYGKLPPLPETRDEVLQLAKILGANPSQDLLLGSDATRASVLKSNTSGQLGKKQVVVFATHGLLAGDLPNLNQPALALAATANPNESPLLTLEDVLSLKMNADWVVLSACNTAGADGRAEEALSGLARGFFYAGSRSLLVTHWSVESESAMLLTTQTFAAYKADPALRRAEALRRAMLATMKDARYKHPAYWSPYALVGEGGR
jgi:CHAT domain-containing protein